MTPQTLLPTHPFAVRTSKRANRPGTWESTLVEILMSGEKIGEYVRNYPSHAEATFAPFKIGERWFALYSRDYTATRIMSLPDCVDIGGEERDGCGFCPVELHVPCYRLLSRDLTHDHRLGQKVEPYVERLHTVLWPWEAFDIADAEDIVAREAAGALEDRRGSNYALSDWQWCPFGFVAGCVWGDDGSWKIEHLDLARATEGVLVRSAPFGYAEMPARMGLRDAIDLSLWEPGRHRIGVSVTRWFDGTAAGGFAEI